MYLCIYLYSMIHSTAIIMFAPAWMKQYRINLAASSNSYTLGLLCTRARVRSRSREGTKKKGGKSRTEKKRREKPAGYHASIGAAK